MQRACVVQYDGVYFGTNTQFWLQSSTLKMEAVRPPDVAYICQYTMRHISEQHDLHDHCCGVSVWLFVSEHFALRDGHVTEHSQSCALPS
jgi:hypothetical protein